MINKKTPLGEMRFMEKEQLINEIRDLDIELISLKQQLRRLELAITRIKFRHITPNIKWER